MVSIIIPCYNAELYIKRTIESVLKQTYTDYELVIINDGSSDDTKTIINQIKSEKIKYFEKSNSGVSDTRNLGFQKYCNGEFVLFLDADDILSENFLTERVNGLTKHKEYGAVCSFIEKIDENDVKIPGQFNSLSNQEELYNLEPNKFTCPSGYLFRSKFLKDNSIFFDNELQSSADKFFLVTFFKFSKILFVDGAPLFYRILPNSMSNRVTPKLLHDQQKYLSKLIGDQQIRKNLSRSSLSHLNYTIAGLSYKLRCYKPMIKHIIYSLIYSPSRFSALFFKRN